MTDPREPHEPQEPDGRPESAAGHVRELAEEIRHEIEEAVEHVPKPVRWTVSRIVRLGLLVLAAVVVVGIASAVLYVMNRTEWVAKELTLIVNQTLARHSDVVLEMRDLRGNPFTGVRVIAPRLRFRDRRGAPLLEAREMRLRYSAFQVVTGGERPIDIELISPRVRLERDANGVIRLPVWRGDRRPGKPGAARTIRIAIRDLELAAPAPIGNVSGFAADATVRTGRGTDVEVRRMRWARGPWGSSLQALEGSWSSGDSVRVRVTKLVSSDLALEGRAAWAAAGGPKRASVSIGRVRWAWLARVFQNGAFDVPGEGRIEAELTGEKTWRGSFTAGVTWNGLPADGTGRFAEDGKGGWRVDGLALRSKAGDLRGRFDYDRAGWVLSGDVERGDPEHWAAINVPGWPAGRLFGRFRYAVDTKTRRSRLDARLRDSDLAGWRADSATVVVDFPRPGSSAFTVDMRRRGGTAWFTGATDSAGWSGRYELRSYALDEWPDGRRSGIRGTLRQGSGTMEARRSGLWVTGTLDGEATDWLGLHTAAWTLDGVRGRLLPVPDLGADARLDDVLFLGLHFDAASLALGLGDRTARLDTVLAWAGDTLVSLGGEARWDSAGWNARFDRASLTSRHFAWVATPPVELAGDPRGVDFRRVEARDGDARFTANGRWAAPGGTYDWTGRAEGLDLGRLGMPDELDLGGRADAVLRVTGISGDPRWHLIARAGRPGTRGHRADSLAIELAGRPHALEVRDFRYELDGGTAVARGEVTGMERAWPDSLTPNRVVGWLAGGSAWRLDGAADRLPLDRLDRLAPSAHGWSGRLSGQLDLAGRPRSPEFRVRLTGEPLAWSGYRMDRVKLDARFADEALTVSDLTITAGPTGSTAHGSLPLRLALGEDPKPLERPMRWEVRAPQGDLRMLPVFVPQIGAASGRFELSATIQGTPSHPDLDGYLRIRDGVVRMAAREEVLEKVTADFTLDEARLTLDSLTARQGDRGRARASGVVRIGGTGPPGYRFDLALREFTTSDPGLYAAEFDGDFVVVNGARLRGQALPQVTGSVDVRRAAILFDFTKQTESQYLAATTQPLYWTYRLDVRANDQLKWTPPDADIEFNADLTMEQTRDSLLIFGEMKALRGTYFFLSNRFAVDRADLVFDNVGGVDPQIDAEAATRIVGTSEAVLSGGAATEQPHTVTVLITGRAKEPTVAFRSDPDDWDEPRILRELTVGRFYNARDAQFRVGDPLDSYLTQALNRTLSAELNRTFKGYLNDWRLEREKGGLIAGEGGYIVSFSSQPIRNVNLRYRQRFGATGDPAGAIEDPFERSVEAEYRLSRFFFVTTELTKRLQTTGGTSSGTSAADFNVNLKARWEY